jgi:hypothetical protein
MTEIPLPASGEEAKKCWLILADSMIPDVLSKKYFCAKNSPGHLPLAIALSDGQSELCWINEAD